MGRLYTVQGLADNVGAALTLLSIQSATTIKPELQDVIVGCGEAVGDQATQFQVLRFDTDDGTGGATPTPEPMDPDSPASLISAAQVDHSGEPSSKGVGLLEIPLHQRATFRWVAAPGRGMTANNVATEGLLIQSTTSTGTYAALCNFIWEE